MPKEKRIQEGEMDKDPYDTEKQFSSGKYNPMHELFPFTNQINHFLSTGWEE